MCGSGPGTAGADGLDAVLDRTDNSPAVNAVPAAESDGAAEWLEAWQFLILSPANGSWTPVSTRTR